jgi:UDP-N-acetylglucosamine:LPS N-acetylglucosamine transferase
LVALDDWYAARDHSWVTFDTPDARSSLAGEDVTYAFHPTTRNLPNLLRNTALAYRILRQKQPSTIVSTGAGVALPFFVFGRLMRRQTVYVEVYDRVDTPTMTGRLCRPFTDLMFVQWPEQLGLYRDARLIGPLL